MAILKSTAESLVTQALGGSPVGRTPTELADQAGVHLMSMRTWNWAYGTRTSANLVASQDYVDLVTGFRGFVTTPRIANTTWTWLDMVSLETMERLRRDTTGVTGTPYYGSLTYAHGGGQPVPRLELYPVPSENVTGGLIYYAKQGWVTWPDEVTAAPIPEWLESLYIEIVRAVARGWEDDIGHPGKTSAYLGIVQKGVLFSSAKETDAVLQPTMGEVKGGVADGWGQTTYLTIDGVGGPA